MILQNKLIYDDFVVYVYNLLLYDIYILIMNWVAMDSSWELCRKEAISNEYNEHRVID